MSIFMRGALLLVVGVLAGTPALAGADVQPAAVGADLQVAPQTKPDAPGKEILQRKCFQCHAASMWTSLGQDRKAWEGVLYRMVGRGALWTEAEITAMADFLAQTRGPK
jgi:cytochrome c5